MLSFRSTVLIICATELNFRKLCILSYGSYIFQNKKSWLMKQNPSLESRILPGSQVISAFMENEVSLLLSHLPCFPMLSHIQVSPFSFLKIHLNIRIYTWQRLPSGLFPSGFLTKTLYVPLPLSLLIST